MKAFLIALGLLLGSQAQAATYNIDFVLDDLVYYQSGEQPGRVAHITGQIQTDGSIGPIALGNIRRFWINFEIGDYTQYVSSGSLAGLLFHGGPSATKGFLIAPDTYADGEFFRITATAREILIGQGGAIRLSITTPANDCYLSVERSKIDVGTGCYPLPENAYATESYGGSVIATVASVPLPAAGLLLPAALGILALRRRRQAER